MRVVEFVDAGDDCFGVVDCVAVEPVETANTESTERERTLEANFTCGLLDFG
jgi:hypothetical protein